MRTHAGYMQLRYKAPNRGYMVHPSFLLTLGPAF